jgi:Family of unknown function (DUF6526)
MAEKVQTYDNHVRWDPAYHFVILPLVLANLIIAIVMLVRHPGAYYGWILVMSIVLVLYAALMRTYPLKAQDRVIRLEERLRLMALCPEPLRTQVQALTPQQLVALRFAPDDELPGLAKKALTEKLTPKQIKMQIVNWQGDHLRI